MTPVANAARLVRTVRYLRPIQILARIRYRLSRPQVDMSAPPPLRSVTGSVVVPAARAASMTGCGTFRFLGRSGSLADGWDNPEQPKLWRYNLHYFDDLNAAGATGRRALHATLIARWISDVRPASGTGWEPYPISLRAVNWIKYALSGQSLSAEAQHSLAIQVRWLSRRLEWHLLGNHLFANAKALIFAGVFFTGEEAEGWLRTGLAIMARELPEQVLADGGQFELSPMYHALLVEDLLDLLALQNAYRLESLEELGQRIRGLIPATLRWLDTMSHPDGGIAFFNDAALGIAPENAELFALAQRLGIAPPGEKGSIFLPASGYLRLESGNAILIADLACIGPDYLPGHAHADTLSVELSLGTQRVIVNSGTSIYEFGAERLRQRGTAAHATVTVAGGDSSEVWSSFRVGRRARPTVSWVQTEQEPTGFDASHDGYRHLPGAPRHTRSLRMTPAGLNIVDRVTGQQPAQARYPLHPAIGVATNGSTAELSLPDGSRVVVKASAPLRVESFSWHPEFGAALASRCLVLDLVDGEAGLSLDWTASDARRVIGGRT